MKRKKFVKQLMAMGLERNMANVMAYLCQHTGTSYEADFRRRAPWLRLARAARQVSASLLNMAKGIKGVAAAAAGLRDALVVHHPQPLTPESLEAGKMYIVTKQEHDRLHGYSAHVSFVDEWDGLNSEKLHDQAVAACAGGAAV